MDDSSIYNKNARAQNKARFFVNETLKMELIILDQKSSSKPPRQAAMLEKNWDRGWFIHQHDLPLVNIDYASGSAHVKIGVWPKVGLQGVLHGRPGVKNPSAAPNKISRT